VIASLIYQGIIIIVLLTISFGPAFFALLNTGIKYGYKTGSFLAFGVVFSDFFLCMMVCLLVHFGMGNLLHSEKAQTFFSIVGGIVLIVFGAFFFRKHEIKTEETIDIPSVPSPSVMILKGFFVNIFNPTVWLLWLANVTAISKTLDYSLVKMILFFSIVLGTVLMVELAKVSLANKIKHYLTNTIMTIINYLTGTALIIFGMVLIYNHYFDRP
jgi:threonine/homoserine/homoserine lactone efflux protein